MCPTNDAGLRQRPSVPREYGGRWIAWNADATRIIASGETLKQCAAEAAKVGEAEAQFEKVPRAEVRIVGMTR
jgi:hypothetical protein